MTGKKRPDDLTIPRVGGGHLRTALDSAWKMRHPTRMRGTQGDIDRSNLRMKPRVSVFPFRTFLEMPSVQFLIQDK